MPHETVTYRRHQLYEEIWKEPIHAVAARYGVSDVMLGKICRKLSVPMPGVGYWARVAAGRKLKKPDLKPLPDGSPSELTTERWVDGPAEIEAKGILAEEEARGEEITVTPELVEPHPLIASTRRVLGKGSRDRTGACLDISVSAAQLDRSLRIMDTLLKALERRGYKVEVVKVGPPERWQGTAIITRAHVDGAVVPFSLSERIDLEPVPDEELTREQRRHKEFWKTSPTRGVATGCLTLLVDTHRGDGTRTSWRDGKHQRVENCLGAVLTAMRLRAAIMRREAAEREKSARQWEREQARRAEAERIAQQEKAREASLRDHVARWIFAQDSRAYAAEVRRVVQEAGVQIAARGPLDESLLWIEGYADRTDPLTPVREEAARVAAAHIAATHAATEQS